jgi:predicted phage tail protein
MRRRVFFHGPYKSAHDGPVEVEAETVREAIALVTSQLPFFTPDLSGRKRIRVRGIDTVEALDQAGPEEIHIYPPLTGGKNGGFVQILIAVVLITVALMLPGGGFAAIMAMEASFLATTLATIGVSMIVGGLIQILMPTPTIDSPSGSDSVEGSKYLGARGNTTKVGTRIPLLFGEDKIFGHILSFNVDAKDVAV